MFLSIHIILVLICLQFLTSTVSSFKLYSLKSKTIKQSKLFSTVSYLEGINALNAEILATYEQNNLLGRKTGGIQSLIRVPKHLLTNQTSGVVKLLTRDGCLSIPKVLSSETCDQLKDFIHTELQKSKDDVTNGVVDFDSRFGGVNCRGRQSIFGTRQDLFLPMSSSIVQKATREFIHSMKEFLTSLVGEDALIHEISSIIADEGAPRQCIHADTAYLPSPQYPNAEMKPLYTFFISLQDISDSMGHTVFLPKTHTSEVHLLWNTAPKQKELFLETRDVVKSNLLQGDVSIFDSRLLHCGEMNSSKSRRILFYLTISSQHEWPLANGLHGSNSIRLEDKGKWKIKNFL